MRSGTELSQFLRIFLPTLKCLLQKFLTNSVEPDQIDQSDLALHCLPSM